MLYQLSYTPKAERAVTRLLLAAQGQAAMSSGTISPDR